MLRSIIFPISILGLLILSACTKAQQPLRPHTPPLDGSAVSAGKQKFYNDGILSFEHPEDWTTQKVEVDDANLHQVDIATTNGVFARVTLLFKSDRPGAFPKEVIEKLQGANHTLKQEPYATALASQNGKGFKYEFKLNDHDWSGWVVSVVSGASEIGFLGQYPKNAQATVKPRMDAIMASLKVGSAGPSDTGNDPTQ